MKIGFAQINPTVGDLRGNFERILSAYERLADAGAELVLTPELAITGYPPQDLVFKSQFVPQNLEVLDKLQARLRGAALLVGYVERNQGRGKPFHNAAALLQPGTPITKTFKSLLPTYDVFDEDRYFEPGCNSAPVMLGAKKIGVTVCEDIWTEHYLPRPFYDVEPVRALVEQGAEIILNLSASPFSLNKPAVRHEMVSALAQAHRRAIFYCNAVGGNDQLVFDGNSIAVNANGELIAQLPGFQTADQIIDTEVARAIDFKQPERSVDLFGALSLGVRDYLAKCGFKSAVLGLSGGIDSAVVAAIAVDALGAENVVGVSMPSPYSSRGSIEDALGLAKNLGIKCLEIPIGNAFAAFKAEFAEIFKGQPENETEENMQPRLRAMTLMALSNKFGHLLLTTGNKSELAVGYCTIYGDMAGGLAVISDVPKTMVYELARWINREREIIPRSTIDKPPSAELRPNQKDEDSLPPYEVLDRVLKAYIEDLRSPHEIADHYGFDLKLVQDIALRVDHNEYKRKQAAPGLKITSRAFGFGRPFPIAQKFIP